MSEPYGKYGEFRFLVQSFIKDHSSVNGLVNKKTVEYLYDMVLDHSRSFVNVKPDAKAISTNTKKKTSGCFNCGSLDHWASECPNNNAPTTSTGKGQSSGSGVNDSQQQGQDKRQSSGPGKRANRRVSRQ